jgi:hypothetical protein
MIALPRPDRCAYSGVSGWTRSWLTLQFLRQVCSVPTLCVEKQRPGRRAAPEQHSPAMREPLVAPQRSRFKWAGIRRARGWLNERTPKPFFE